MARRPRKCVPVNFRCFRYFNGFRNITVSEICLRFPKYVYGIRNIFTVSEICLRFPKYVYGFRYICDVSRCRESPGGPPDPGASCHAPVTAGGPRIGVLAPSSFFLSVTSVVPVPDGTETQEMCPREFP
jgi:hypothetical protein